MHTSHRRTTTACLSALWPLLGLVAAQSNAADDGRMLPDVVVTGTREGTSLNETPAAVGVIPKESIERTRPNHPSQIVGQVPGVAVAVTNGEGHTTAIRQPFTTNPVYLFLEDGIPIRSTGFFNHNALYEINIPQAGGIEVTRGPGLRYTARMRSAASSMCSRERRRANPNSESPESSADTGSGEY